MDEKNISKGLRKRKEFLAMPGGSYSRMTTVMDYKTGRFDTLSDRNAIP